MTIRNPIDQRHANPTATRCSAFWRNFGTKFAWFLALYPWSAIVIIAVTGLIVLVCELGLNATGMPSTAGTLRRSELFVTLMLWLIVCGALLYPVGVVWSIVMTIAVRRGHAPQKPWLICMLVSLPFQSILPFWPVPFVVMLVLGLAKPIPPPGIRP